jgi:uncharacterized OsmC-like protein
MYGTLRRALLARQIEVDPERYLAKVEGRIEKVGSCVRITEIAVQYTLAISAGKRAEAERALACHAQGCPAHESVKDAIRVTWSADIQEIT